MCPIRRTLMLVVVALALFILPACPFGHGGDGDSGTRRSLHADIPLEIFSRSPAPDEADVARGALVRVTFNIYINEESIMPGAVHVRDAGGDVPGTCGPWHDAEGFCLGAWFRPHSPWVYDTCFTVTVTTDIESLHGDSLDVEDVWTFCVASPPTFAWQPPVTFDTASGNARFPDLALAEDGTPNVLYIEEDGDDYDIVWNQHSASYGGWLSGARIEEAVGSLTAPRVGSYGDFSSTFVFARRRIDVFEIREMNVIASPLGGDLSGILQDAHSVGRSVESIPDPELFIDEGGTGLAVWVSVDSLGGDREIYSHRIRSPLDLSGHYLVFDLDIDGMTGPRLAGNRLGNAFLVCETEFPAKPFLYGARYERDAVGSGWVWSGEIDMPPSPFSARQPAVGIGEDDHAVVVWIRESTDEATVQAVILGPEDDVPPSPVNLSDGLSGRSSRPYVAVGRFGDVIAVWAQEVGPLEHSIMAMRYVPGVGWTDRVAVDTQTNAQENPFVCIGPGRDAIVVWHDYDIHASHHEGGATWTDRVTLSTSFSIEDATRPRVAIDEDGRATAVWQQQEYGPLRSTVRTARFE